jgi:uncharacterized delta-60 repeat protein
MRTKLALSALLLLLAAQYGFAQNFSVEITPLSAVVLPDTGGTISYRVTITNQETIPRTADLWLKCTMPNGSIKPVLGPITQTFLGSQSFTRDRQQTLLPASPVGYYTLHAYVGLYPNTVWTQADLECQKQVLTGGVEQAWVARYSGPAYEWDEPAKVMTDEMGKVYVTGSSWGVDTGTDFVTIKYNTNGEVDWINRFTSPGIYEDEATCMAMDSANNIYVAGYSHVTGTTSNYTFTTIKYNNQGVQQWVAYYSGPGSSFAQINDIKIGQNGMVYVTGKGKEYYTAADYLTVMYDSAGVQQWASLYDSPFNSEDFAVRLAVDGIGNACVTGYSFGSGTYVDFATVKYDANGIQQWVARYNGPGNLYDYAKAIVIDGDGNVYVTGTGSTGGSYYSDITTIKYNIDGITQWVARYDTSLYTPDEASDIAIDSERNLYITGSKRFASSYYLVTLKYNTDGNLLWQNPYYDASISDDKTSSITLDSERNIYISGSINGDYSAMCDFITIKYNTIGMLQWSAQFNGWMSKRDCSRSVAVNNLGYVCVTGRCEINSTAADYDFATIKYSQPAVPNWQQVEAVPFGAPLSQECRLEAPAPNPFNPTTAISFELQAASQVRLTIYDTAGRLVTTLVNGWREAGTHEVTFDGSALASGMYFVRMQAGEYLAIQKIVLVK